MCSNFRILEIKLFLHFIKTITPLTDPSKNLTHTTYDALSTEIFQKSCLGGFQPFRNALCLLPTEKC